MSDAAGPGGGARERFLTNPAAVMAAAVIAVFVLVAALAPVLAPRSPLEQDLANNFARPSLAYPLGTDDLGRDVLSRLIYGARISLTVSVVSIGLGAAMGSLVGLVSAYRRGWVDVVLMRLTDVMLSIPDFLLAVVVVATLGKGVLNTILAVAIYAVPTFARIARGSALSVAELDYVAAARVAGAPAWRILARHVFPNVLTPLVVQTTLMLGTAIVIASGLSFLGLGVQPPDPEWGAMLSKGRELIRSAPLAAIAPGIAITLVVLSFSLLGDGLRDALDPKLTRR